ncbi:hypothetical protein K8R14_01790 [bacterium]|nr:hypothetical protein [bacterium]
MSKSRGERPRETECRRYLSTDYTAYGIKAAGILLGLYQGTGEPNL